MHTKWYFKNENDTFIHEQGFLKPKPKLQENEGEELQKEGKTKATISRKSNSKTYWNNGKNAQGSTKLNPLIDSSEFLSVIS